MTPCVEIDSMLPNNLVDITYHYYLIRLDLPVKPHYFLLGSLLNWASYQSGKQVSWFLFIYKTLIGKISLYLQSILNIYSTNCSLCFIVSSNSTYPKTWCPIMLTTSKMSMDHILLVLQLYCLIE